MINLHYLFYTEYYTAKFFDAPEESKDENATTKVSICKGHNKTLSDATLVHPPAMPHSDMPHIKYDSFLGKTLYPGLLIGLGYHHDPGGSKEAIQLGFSFDYVTGMPYIPGSTVKGVLRSAFRNYGGVIAELDKIPDSIKAVELKSLEKAIFGEWVKPEDGDAAPCLNERDIFFDAVVVEANGRILGEEYITPHMSKSIDEKGGGTQGDGGQDGGAASGEGDEKKKVVIPRELVEPNPIKLLKILPGVTLEFRFALRDSFIDGKTKITAADKIELFKELIELLGVGAKTNVGFGGIKIVDGASPPKDAVKSGGKEQRQSAAPQQKTVANAGNGRCSDCGGETKRNKKTGKYYQRCAKCNGKYIKELNREVRSVGR